MADAVAGVAVAVGIVNVRHPVVFGLVIQQVLGLAHDAVSVGADQLHGAGLHGFGPLGFLAHHENGLS